MSGIQDELDSMINALEGNGSDELQGTTIAPNTDAPATASPSTESPATDAPATDAPATVAPSTDAPTDRDDELARLMEENAQLKADAELLKKGKGGKPTTTAPATEAPSEPLNFVSETELEDALGDPNKFNTLLGKVYTRAVSDTKKLFEPKLSDLPGMVSQQVSMLENMKKVYDNFYNTNPDLKPFQKVVRLVFEEMSVENPDKLYVDVIKDVAPEVRRRLGLKEGAKPREKPTGKKDVPDLPGKRGRTGIIDNKQPKNVTSEIEEMNEALER